MLRPENVATPATAATVFVPDKVPLLGFVPIATVTFPVNPVAVFPLASWAVTWTAGVIAAPATVVLGCTENTSCVAEIGIASCRELVVLPAPVVVSVQPGAALSRLSHVNVAPPSAAAWVFVPDRVPLLGFVPIATVTFPVNPVAVLPLPS